MADFPIWPEALPAMLLAPTYVPRDPTIRTTMQNGRDIVRRNFSAVPEEFAPEWVLTDAQAAAFEAFYWHDLDCGSRWFMMPVRLPQGMEDRLVQFVGAFKRVQLTGHDCARWRYSANMLHYYAWRDDLPLPVVED